LKQTILASGGNEFSSVYKAADLAALQNAKVANELLVIVTAPYPTQDLAYQTAKNYFNSLGVNTKMSLVLDKSDSENSEYAQEIASASAIYLAGGTPARLVETFINTLVGEALMSAVNSEAVLMGSSAGAMLMSRRVVMPSGEDLGEGLNLLHDSIVLPHFHSQVPQWINEYRSKNIKFIGLAEGGSILTSVTEETSITEFGSVTYL
jgi:cyanophycinase-like exopeptidase